MLAALGQCATARADGMEMVMQSKDAMDRAMARDCLRAEASLEKMKGGALSGVASAAAIGEPVTFAAVGVLGAAGIAYGVHDVHESCVTGPAEYAAGQSMLATTAQDRAFCNQTKQTQCLFVGKANMEQCFQDVDHGCRIGAQNRTHTLSVNQFQALFDDGANACFVGEGWEAPDSGPNTGVMQSQLNCPQRLIEHVFDHVASPNIGPWADGGRYAREVKQWEAQHGRSRAETGGSGGRGANIGPVADGREYGRALERAAAERGGKSGGSERASGAERGGGGGGGRGGAGGAGGAGGGRAGNPRL